MKTSIYFWYKEENVLSINDTIDSSFKVGDKLYFNIEEMYPRTIEALKKEFNEQFILDMEKNEIELHEKYGRDRFKIISKHITITKSLNSNEKYSTKIEYFVTKSPKFYWKWWYIKSLFK